VIVSDVYKELQETNDELIYNLIVNVVNRKMSTDSYSLAKHVIETNIDILAGPIDTFVHSIFTVRTDPTDELSEETYSLVFELYRIHSDLVLKSIGLLSDEMNSQVTDRRAKSCMLVGRISSQSDNIILKDFPQLMTEYFASARDENVEVRKQIGYTSCKLLKNAELESDLLLKLQTHLVDLLRDSEVSVRQKIVDKLGEKILK